VRALPSVAGLKPDQGQSPKSIEWLTAGQIAHASHRAAKPKGRVVHDF